jgi:RHS repeat-associated protein
LKDHISNQRTFFSGPVEYVETGGSGSLVFSRSQVFLGDSVLSTSTYGYSSESTEFNHPDRLGTRLITNQSGGTVSEQAHLPFGRALNAESTVTNYSKRFTSYERSAQTGLDYAQNRTYDSKQGRFTQVDPIGMQAVSLVAPQTLNLYTYCGNDPVNYVDPSGLFWGFLKKVFKWVIAAVAVVAAIVAIVVAVILTAGAFGVALAGFAAAGGTTMGVMGAITSIVGAALSVRNAVGAIMNALQAKDVPPRSGPCTLDVPGFDKLRALGGAAFSILLASFGDLAKSTYEKWGTYNQAVYTNTIDAVAAQGVDLSTAKMTDFYYGDGSAATSKPFGVNMSGVTNANLDRAGLGKSKIPRMGRRSPRNIETASIEASVNGNNVAFDVDLYNAKSRPLDHWEEAEFNRKNKTTTHPADVLRGLNGRGVVTLSRCK